MGRALKITLPYFLPGVFLTALYQTYFPTDLTNYIFSWNPGSGLLCAEVLGVPLYACGGGYYD
jgi:uncharacterized membrane protein YraQ (UPF0718 family)